MLSPYLNNFYKENGFGRITATYYTNLYIDKTNKENKYRTASGPHRITTAGHKNRNRTAGPRNAHRHARSNRSPPLRRPNRQGAASRRMPTGTRGEAPANPSRNRPGKGRFRPFRQDPQTRKAPPPKEAYPRLQRNPYRDDPARRPGTNASRIALTISGSRLTVPERISPARRPEASPPKRSGKEPSGPPSPENLRTTGRMSSRLFLRAAGADSGNDFPARSLLVTGS